MDPKSTLEHEPLASGRSNGEVEAPTERAGSPGGAEPFRGVLERTLTRRAMLRGAAYAGATLVVTPASLLAPDTAAAASAESAATARPLDPGARLRFATIAPSTAVDVVVPPNYLVDVVLRWGDPLFPDAPAFDPLAQTPEAQARQFGYNADLVLWYPLPNPIRRAVAWSGRLAPKANRWLGGAYLRLRDEFSNRALMVVNHEYTSGGDMFVDYDGASPTENQVLVEIEAHGFSVVELVRDRQGRWHFDRKSPFNRRVTGSTAIEITGPLRGQPEMMTSADPTGTQVLGCFNNCAGGKTPWGTILTCEENFDQYFANFDAVPAEIAALSNRIAAPGAGSERLWEAYVPRFDLAVEPQEYNRFGFIVEVDPYDPSATPKKRTALGRFKHEGAATRIAGTGQVAVYSGDDSRFEYVYKFISDGRFNPHDRAGNLELLESGTLYAARFDAGLAEDDDMGTGEWLELSPANPLLADWSMTQILLNTRGAADVVGATPMDRPEDIEVSPRTGKIYIALTNNSQRTGDPGSGATRTADGRTVSTEPNAANPRNDTYDDGDPDSNTGNEHGHVIELIERDAAELRFRWNILIRCGDPAVAAHDTRFGNVTDPLAAGVSPISDPDNLVHDELGNLWIATDGMPGSGGDKGFGQNDGVFAVPVEGAERGLLRQFLSGVPGGEICGPEFSGDNRTFFCAIQHPYEGEGADHADKWPLGEAISRPSLIAVREKAGRKIGL